MSTRGSIINTSALYGNLASSVRTIPSSSVGRPEHEHAMLLMPVGYPADNAQVPDLRRKALDEVSSFFE